MKKKWTRLMIVPAFAVAAGYPRKLDITRYRILTPAVHSMVRLAIISDLHNASYGIHMEELMQAIRKERPDVILLPGDLFQERTDNINSVELVRQLSGYPMFFSTGNHEAISDDPERLKSLLRSMDVIIPEQSAVPVNIRGSLLEIASLPSGYKQKNAPYDADAVNHLFHTDGYRILLSHQPHWTSLYQSLDVDLTVSGHAHGGQWRLPGTEQGVGAPEQGLFPRYTSGIHAMNSRNYMIISRGLCRYYHGIPRLFNNPELVIVSLQNKENTDADQNAAH